MRPQNLANQLVAAVIMYFPELTSEPLDATRIEKIRRTLMVAFQAMIEEKKDPAKVDEERIVVTTLAAFGMPRPKAQDGIKGALSLKENQKSKVVEGP